MNEEEYPCAVTMPCGHSIATMMPVIGTAAFEFYCPVDGWQQGYELLAWHPAFMPRVGKPWDDPDSDPISDLEEWKKRYEAMD